VSRVVVGVGASHTTLMNTRWDDVNHLDRAHRFRDALAEARRAVEASGADVAVVLGSNHFRGFWLDLMPAFTIGVGEVIAAGEHGTPQGPQPTDPELARHLLAQVVRAGFDPAFSARLQVDHGITHALQYVVPEGVPVVPVVINSFAPPLPSLARCAALGEALARAVASHPGDRRVAVIGSGGLSHRLPFPDWRSPASDDDEFLVRSWLDGRNDWQSYEDRRRRIVVSAPPDLNEGFDADVLARLERGELATLVDLEDDLVPVAGNGANEIRGWLAMAAACGWAPGRRLCYSPMPEWLTGMAVAVIDHPAEPAPEDPRPLEERAR
jgi:2,3-dihydroxyphenylpropionate 1,2-dioxygenase